MGPGSLIGLRPKVGCGRLTLAEVAGENWLDERTKDDLGAAVMIVVSHIKARRRTRNSYPVIGRDIHRIRTNLNV